MELNQILAFLKQAEQLKSVERDAWTSTGKRETTAEHSWRLALFAGLLKDAYPNLDWEKVFMMCLIHDLGEVYRGDISAVTRPDPDKKFAIESEDAKRAFSFLPAKQGASLYQLWMEYNEALTPEAKLVKALDKAETILQHNQGINPPEFDYAFNLEYGKGYFEEDPLLRSIRGFLDAETQQSINTQKNSVREGR